MTKVRDTYRTWDSSEFNFLRLQQRRNEECFIRGLGYLEIRLDAVIQIGGHYYKKIRLELKDNG